METILLKELTLDSAEEIVELITISAMKLNCRVEKGMTNQTVDCIIKVDPYDVAFTIRHDHRILLFEFEDENEAIRFELSYNDLTDLVIR